MLLERCRPGSELRQRPEAEQHGVITSQLRSVWAVDLPPKNPFRPLSVMTDSWATHAEARLAANPRRVDGGLAREGLALFPNCRAPEPQKYCCSPTSTPATCSRQNATRGCSSIRSPMSGIRTTTCCNTCSTATARSRRTPSGCSAKWPIWQAWRPSEYGSGYSLGASWRSLVRVCRGQGSTSCCAGWVVPRNPGHPLNPGLVWALTAS